MCQFIETIRIEEDRIYNLPYHNYRLNQTRKSVFGIHAELDLQDVVCSQGHKGRTKCRVEYDKEILKVEYALYHIRPVRSLQIVRSDDIDYRYKSNDREQLNRLFAQRGACDDILIVRNGLVTDTSICNIALWNGSCWITPSRPLLCGTKRASLLEAGLLTEQDVTLEALNRCTLARLFNAMIDFGEVELDVRHISLP